MSKTLQLKLTAALMLGGVMQLRGTTVEVSEMEARNLLQRGRAELLEGEEFDPAGPFGAGLTGNTLNGDELTNANAKNAPPVNNNTVDVTKLNYAALQQYAAEHHSEIPTNIKKDLLLKAIQEAELPKDGNGNVIKPADDQE